MTQKITDDLRRYIRKMLYCETVIIDKSNMTQEQITERSIQKYANNGYFHDIVDIMTDGIIKIIEDKELKV